MLLLIVRRWVKRSAALSGASMSALFCLGCAKRKACAGIARKCQDKLKRWRLIDSGLIWASPVADALPCCQDPILARPLKSAGSYGATSGIRTRPSKQSRTYFRLAASRTYAPYPRPPFDFPPYSGRLLSDPSGSGPKSAQNL